MATGKKHWGAVCLCGLLLAGCRSATLTSPPGQPASGPGGADYPHGKVITQRHGEGGEEYWLFQPDDPRPADAPVVIFLHGWGGMSPRVYGAWIRHIVRKGHIVVYPRYQATLTTRTEEMMPDALHAVQSALGRLSSDGSVRPRLDRIAWVGHSLGGVIAINLAAAYAENALPPPAVVMGAEPGGESRLPLAPLEGLPSETLVLLVVGEEDEAVSDAGATAIAAALGHMPRGSVELVTVRSDTRSDPPLIADHLAALASALDFPPNVSNEGEAMGESGAPPVGPLRRLVMQRQADRFAPDALDYYGFWKLLDGLLDSAFRGTNREYALGDTQQQRYMGRLSNGEAVTPLVVASP